MPSFKPKFRPSTVAGAPGAIYYQVIHLRRVRQLPTNYHLLPHEWDADAASVIVSPGSPRQHLLLSIRECMRCDLYRLDAIARRLDEGRAPYSADDIVAEFNRQATRQSLFNFMEGVIARLKLDRKLSTAQNYRATLLSFRRYRNEEDILLAAITSQVMESYEAWLKGQGIAPNTISFYMRTLRAVYNRAVEEEITPNRSPFRHVYTGVDKTVKRALPLAALRKIKSLNLYLSSRLEYARDIFLLSFYLRGMSFIDMAYLRKSDLQNGHITYRRRKTGQRLTIAWTPEMQRIVDKYPANESQYLLPIICKSGANDNNVYKRKGCAINKSLKTIAEMAGITMPLTLYVARHSWASAARDKGIPLSVISEGMGHDSETTTRIYLASLDTTVVDRANSLILSAL